MSYWFARLPTFQSGNRSARSVVRLVSWFVCTKVKGWRKELYVNKLFRIRLRMTPGEILFLILLVAILLAMLFNALAISDRSIPQEFAIQNQINNLELAVESFKTKFGFYPPDFTNIREVDDFKPILNQLAPEQKEVSSGGLEVWWNSVGCHLGPKTALTFWLSSLSDDPNYPLTYFDPDSGTRKALPIGAFPVLGESGSEIDVTRILFFDFPHACLKPSDGGVFGIRQDGGENEVLYLSSPYRLETKDLVGTSCLPFYFYDEGKRVFFNPDSYQIYAPGNDEKYVDSSSGNDADPYDLSEGLNGATRDNFFNFSNGLMESLER